MTRSGRVATVLKAWVLLCVLGAGFGLVREGTRVDGTSEASAVSFALATTPGTTVASPASQGIPRPTDAEIDRTLFLLGDAGQPAKNEPVLESLKREASRNASANAIVFLGDNIYPKGLPRPDDPSRKEAQDRLDAQIEVASSGARVFFVPGNHDWAKHADDGWEAILRQGNHIRGKNNPAVAMAPSGGCPGPEVRTLGDTVLLVFLDTQWWLHKGPKPQAPSDTCPFATEKDVEAALGQALDRAGSRHAIVLAHHPLMTGGPHGGKFGFTDHVFPTRNAAAWMWLPLPGLGSAYPLARALGISPQDIASAENTHMREALTRALTPRRPLLFASGHDHSLQVLKGTSARNLLVSGAGIFGHTTRVVKLPEADFAESAAGFMRVDALKNRRVRLGVFLAKADGTASEVFSKWLE